MGALYCRWSQQWAIIRRHFTVVLRHPIGSLLRIIIWPGLILSLVAYLTSQTNPGDYGHSVYIAQIPLIAVITTIFHLYAFINYLVSDKSTGMKSLMISMGMSRFNYYCAMSICLIALILPISLMISIISKLFLFDESLSYFTLLAFFILFSFHLDALVAACVSFISSTSYSFLAAAILFLFEGSVEAIARFIIKRVDHSWNDVVLFLVSSSPFETVRLFCSNYLISHSPTPLNSGVEDNIVFLEQPLHLIFLAQIFWIVVLRLFAYWFEEVCPWQSVSAARGCFFCFTGRDHRLENIEESGDSDVRNSRYFEHRQHAHHEAGIKISRITKVFNTVPAVNELSFTIYKGETTLLLGHNGAGKSTLMNIILGLLQPNAGFVAVKSRSSSIGVCPQTSILDDDLTVKQHLELFNDIKSNISGHERVRHIYQTIVDVSLVGQENKRPTELSGGMKRKLSLALAFVGKSDVLILDEPSSGLDPDSRTFVWNAIRRYRSDRTVLLSTQHMEEADYLGDRIAIMSAGRIVCCGSSVFLNKLFGTGYKLRIECKLSRRQHIFEHIKKNYFDAIQPTEGSTDIIKLTQTDPIIDLVLELKSTDKAKDTEFELIRLLEDLENNSENLSIRSHGLKSSSLEDVMLNTSKYFAAHDTNESTHLFMNTIKGQVAALTESKTSKPTISDLLYALVVKHLQVYRANWFSVIFFMIGLPLFEIYSVLTQLKKRVAAETFWQNPGLVLIIFHLIYYPVRERASKFKIMQLDSSLTVWIYWLAQAITDMIGLIICIVAMNIFAAIFVRDILVPVWQFHALLTLATLCFYLASMAFCYCLSNIFSNARSSIGYLGFLSISSIAVYFVIYLFRLAILQDLKRARWTSTIVEDLAVILFPTDAFALFFYGLSSRCFINNYGGIEIMIELSADQCTTQSGPSPVLFGILAMCVQVIAYTILLVLIEAQLINIEWYCTLRNIFPCFNKPPRVSAAENREVDRDVVEETTKALMSIKEVHDSQYALVAAQLKKSYVKNHKIIENLSFTAKKGECLGLLGVNGAGKTTTISMLASEAQPDSGRILANCHYHDENLHEYRRMFGFDPQATPELSLTPYQALCLMARLRGVDENQIPSLIRCVLDLLEMNQHAHKCDQQLSGGTKRKLALGMALIGSPSILVLDEPTAGVDPLARRGVWQLLKSLRLRNDVSIIISSHAMEECEAICDRITIMARGRLRCIGSFLHLRSKFAKGCTLRVQFMGPRGVHSDKPAHSNGSDKHSPSQETASGASGVAAPCEQYSMGLVSGQHPGQATHNNGKSKSSSDEMRRRSSTSSLVATNQIVEELQQSLSAAVGPGVSTLADRNVNTVTFNITDNRVRRSTLFRMMRDFRHKHPNVSYMINDSSLEDIFVSLAREQQELEQQQVS